jgi:drug/metabolite transporter (DMT)-like permease
VTTGLVPILGIGAVVVFGPAVVYERMAMRMSLAGWGSIALLGAGCTGLSYSLLARGMRDLDLVTVAIVSAITPGLTVLAAHLFLDEPVEGYALWGLALIVGGILVSARGRE